MINDLEFISVNLNAKTFFGEIVMTYTMDNPSEVRIAVENRVYTVNASELMRLLETIKVQRQFIPEVV